MRKNDSAFQRTREVVKKLIQQNGGEVTYKEIADKAELNNLATVRNYLKKMIVSGEIAVLRAPQRGQKVAHYAVNTGASEEKFIKIYFQGVELMLLKTDLGLCLDKETLAFATLEEPEIIDKIMSSNKELFQDAVLLLEGKTWFSKEAVVHYLMKVNLDRVLPIKKEVLLDFQKNVVSKMCNSLSCTVSVEHRNVKIKHNLSCLTEIKKEDIEKMFGTLVRDLNSIFQDVFEKQNAIEKRALQFENLYNNERHSKERYISENIALKGKLLEK